MSPLDASVGPVQITVVNENGSSPLFLTTRRNCACVPLVWFDEVHRLNATHAIGSPLGPVSMSARGYPFTPARPGETVVL